jgi:hypothetical protein
MEEETASDRDWPAGRFFLKCCEGYISHTKLEPSELNSQMLEGCEEHNISKNQPDPTVNTETWQFEFLLSRYSLSLSLSLSLSHSFGHPRYFLHNFAIYIANLSIFTKTPLYQVWVPFSFNQMLFLSPLLKYHVKNLSL